MKQLLFLLLFPCLAMAQYPANGNQKITLGEQTSADGLVYRGVANDTNVITPFSDTSAYIILDTVNSKFYHYNRTTTYWSLAGGGGDSGGVTSFSGGTTGLTPSTATTGAVTLGGTLAVANGGTGSATKNFVDLTTAQTVAGAKTFNANIITQKSLLETGAVYYGFSNNNNNFKGYFGYGGSLTNRMALSNNANDGIFFIVSNYNDAKIMLRLDSTYKVMIGGDISPTEVLDVNGNARIRSVAAGTFANNLNITSDGTLTTATSDEKYKYNILPINYGLNTILQLKPVNFQWINGEENDLGFIAQDVAEIIPEAVSTNWNSDLLFRYESIIPILTKAIQEQNALIKALEQRILTLENK